MLDKEACLTMDDTFLVQLMEPHELQKCGIYHMSRPGRGPSARCRSRIRIIRLFGSVYRQPGSFCIKWYDGNPSSLRRHQKNLGTRRGNSKQTPKDRSPSVVENTPDRTSTLRKGTPPRPSHRIRASHRTPLCPLPGSQRERGAMGFVKYQGYPQFGSMQASL